MRERIANVNYAGSSAAVYNETFSVSHWYNSIDPTTWQTSQLNYVQALPLGSTSHRACLSYDKIVDRGGPIVFIRDGKGGRRKVESPCTIEKHRILAEPANGCVNEGSAISKLYYAGYPWPAKDSVMATRVLRWNNIIFSRDLRNVEAIRPPQEELQSFLFSAYHSSKPGNKLFRGLTELIELRDLPGLKSLFSPSKWRETVFSIVHRSPKRKLKELSDKNLGIQFGAIPVIGAIFKLRDAFLQLDDRINWLRDHANTITKRTREKSWEYFSTETSGKLYPGDMPWTGEVTYRCRRMAKLTSYWTFTFPVISRLEPSIRYRLLGVGNLDITQIYAALPWTWLLDWFTRASSLLKNYESPVVDNEVTISNPCLTVLDQYAASGQATVRMGSTYVSVSLGGSTSTHGIADYYVNIPVEQTLSVYGRSYPSIPSSDLSFSGLGPNQLGLLASLATKYYE